MFLCVCVFLVCVLMYVFVGSGFVSQDLYLHGYFSASIKLPADYTAVVVVAFYVSFYLCILLMGIHSFTHLS